MGSDRQFRLCCKGTFLSALYSWDSEATRQYHSKRRGIYPLPYDVVLPWYVFSLPHANLALHICRIQRCRYLQNHVVCVEFRIEVRSKVDGILDAGFGRFSDMGLKPEGKVDVCS